MTKRVKVRVVADATAITMMVCFRVTIPLLRPENFVAACSECGTAVQVHPSSPKEPSKVCVECAITLAGADGLAVTREQVAFATLDRWPGGTRQ